MHKINTENVWQMGLFKAGLIVPQLCCALSHITRRACDLDREKPQRDYIMVCTRTCAANCMGLCEYRLILRERKRVRHNEYLSLLEHIVRSRRYKFLI